MGNLNDENDDKGFYSFFHGFFKKPYSLMFLIILLFGLGYTLMADVQWGFKNTSRDIITSFRHADAVRLTAINSYKTKLPGSIAITNEYNYLDLLKAPYIRTAETFGVHYYSLVTVLCIASIATSLLVAIISRKGWKKQSPNVKSAFYGFFFCASLPAILITTLNFSQNSTNNINKYFYLTNLQTDIYNVVVAGVPNPVKDSTLSKVCNGINSSLKDNMNLFLDVKADNIPVADLKKVLGK